MSKALFIGSHYAALALFTLACWGGGELALRRLLVITPMNRWLAHGLSVCCGIGFAICALQALALGDLLVAPALLALLAVGLAAAVWCLAQAKAVGWPGSELGTTSTRGLHWTIWLLLLLGLGSTLHPLFPPYEWDELNYHLPHARVWAQSGGLQINEWLRYPYFPYNFHLLYAAALVLYDDVMPHLLHALAGWTTALLLYQWALRYGTRLAALLASAGWLALAQGEFGNAYVDMALAMCLTAALICFLLWWPSARPCLGGWMLPAAFLLGVAAGIKYQMLAFLPFFAFVTLLRERRPKTLLLLLAAGLLPCMYWYARNAWLTGDPFNPFGAGLFGFSDWNAADLDYQMRVLREIRDWPHWLLWPAALAALLPSVWRKVELRLTLGFGLFAFMVWLVSSHFSRYLLPAYPVLLLLCAHVVTTLGKVPLRWIASRRAATGQPLSALARGRMQGVIGAMLAALALLTTARSVDSDWPKVAASAAQRETFLAAQLWEYQETLDFLNQLTPKPRAYQHGLEGALYYAPQSIYGDHFGRWRYTDFINLTPPRLAARMAQDRLDTLVLRSSASGILLNAPDLLNCFTSIHKSPTFETFRLKQKSGGCGTWPAPSTPIPPFVIGPNLLPSPPQ